MQRDLCSGQDDMQNDNYRGHNQHVTKTITTEWINSKIISQWSVLLQNVQKLREYI